MEITTIALSVAAAGIVLIGIIGIMRMKSKYGPKKLRLGRMIRLCPGGFHAWYESDHGPVRKPFWDSGAKGVA